MDRGCNTFEVKGVNVINSIPIKYVGSVIVAAAVLVEKDEVVFVREGYPLFRGLCFWNRD